VWGQPFLAAAAFPGGAPRHNRVARSFLPSRDSHGADLPVRPNRERQ
jgi:hypothetical protein